MYKILSVFVCLMSSCLIWRQSIFAEAATSNPATSNAEPAVSPQKFSQEDFRGWNRLVLRLWRDGVDEAQLRKIYQSKRMPRFDTVPFSISPRETSAQYNHFARPSQLALARKFALENDRILTQTEKQFRVDKHVIAAVLLIETHFGKVTGKALIIERLSRLANIGQPSNLEYNYKRLKKEDPKVTFEQVEARAKYLEAMFYPEIPALFQLSKRLRIDLFAIKGSSAGAFGIPQFLPTSFVKFAIDGDKNGIISLFSVPDAVASTANFLASYGWKNDAPDEHKRSVIWKYNHSDAYIDTILAVAHKLHELEEAQRKKPAPTAKKKGKKK